jgi:DNA repair photolyase
VTLISKFDPWHSTLCTCPSKLTFNPYTGCDHNCAYCYASSYIPNFSNCRPKKDLLSRLENEARKLKGQTVSIANSSDPYPNLEAKAGLTRKCLEILSKQDCKVQIITKSDLVLRDADLLEKMRSMISITITTDNDDVARRIEPNASPPSNRLKAVETLIKKDIPLSVRVDPIIPFLNDKPESLIRTIAALGVKHVTSSTLKVKTENWRRLSVAVPEIAGKLRPLYFEKGEKVGRCTYLPTHLRTRLMKSVSDLAKTNHIEFGACREGLAQLNTATCDGLWLLGKTGSKLA